MPRLPLPRPDQSKPTAHPLGDEHSLPTLRWHIERYDRLRVSTASRAAIVLSAGAILSAGNAVILAQVFGGGFDRSPRWPVTLFILCVLVSVGMVMLSLLRAASVLTTPRPSDQMFSGSGSLPPSLLFNGTHTVSVAPTFADFRKAIEDQRPSDQIEAAQVELFIIIRQHRYRYQRLRAAVRSLAWAATTFVIVLIAGSTLTLIGRFY